MIAVALAIGAMTKSKLRSKARTDFLKSKGLERSASETTPSHMGNMRHCPKITVPGLTRQL